MKYLLLGLVLFIGCAHTAAPPATESKLPNFADLLSILGDAPKDPTPPCLLNGCTYNIHDEIDEGMAKDFTHWMESVKANHVTQYIISLDTPGGSVEDGFVIIHAIEGAQKEGINSTCRVDIQAASMGFLILEACGKREMTKRSSLMAHEIKISIKGHMSQGDFENAANMLRVDNRAIAEHCVAHMKITVEEYQAHTANGKEWHIGWEEALKVGAVDSIIKP